MEEIQVKLIDGSQIISVNGKSYKIIIESLEEKECICGCGESRSTEKSKYATPACRTRMYRARQNISS